MSDGKLLPCPFCGGEDLHRTIDQINATDRVNCRTCKANAVLLKWNNRTPLPGALGREDVDPATDQGEWQKWIDQLDPALAKGLQDRKRDGYEHIVWVWSGRREERIRRWANEVAWTDIGRLVWWMDAMGYEIKPKVAVAS